MANIINSPVRIDQAQQAIAQMHTHANMVILNRLGEVAGQLTYGGNPLSGITTVANWAPSTAYAVNELILHNGVLYRATTAHTSVATFNPANWQAVGGATVVPVTEYVRNTPYTEGYFAYLGNRLFRITTGFTSANLATVDASLAADITAGRLVEVGGGVGGTTNHAALTNLGFAQSGHTGFAPENHNHALADVTDFNAANFATAAQGALADTALQTSDLTAHNTNNTAHADIRALITALTSDVRDIEDLIPGTASDANLLATMDDIANMTARRLTFDAQRNAFPTYAHAYDALEGYTNFYYRGAVTDPELNDVIVVLADERYGGVATENACAACGRLV